MKKTYSISFPNCVPLTLFILFIVLVGITDCYNPFSSLHYEFINKPGSLINSTSSKNSDIDSYLINYNSSQSNHVKSIIALKSSLSYTPHGSIHISSNIELATIAIRGNGNKTTPYVLEGWSITAIGDDNDCIYIQGTTNYFVIQNCLVSTGLTEDTGIRIEGVKEGTATIINNTCLNSGVGIWIKRGRNSTVINNVCNDNMEIGIILDQSENSKIINNTCNSNTQCGILLEDSAASVVEHNICYRNIGYGISVLRSWNSILTNNTCNDTQATYWGIYGEEFYGCGIDIKESDRIYITHNKCHKNEIGIVFNNSNLPVVANNTCNQNKLYNIGFRNGVFANIANNSCSQNFVYGIYLENFNISLFKHNTFQKNLNGIYLTHSSYSLISWNYFLENQDYGIEISSKSYYNRIHHNFFLNNGGLSQASDGGINNLWFDNSTMEGNYWSDYSGTQVYHLKGIANSFDPYPLDESFNIIHLDSDQDGMPDWWEDQLGFNKSLDDSIDDTDQDGLTNVKEFQFGLDPLNFDSDQDELSDGWEVQMGLNPNLDDATRDLDSDGIPNLWEYQMGLNATNSLDAFLDKDDDGLLNLWEYEIGLNATNSLDATQDMDADGLPNFWEYRMGLNIHNAKDANKDADNDGMSNLWEYQMGLDASNPQDAAQDRDIDGLSNLWEYQMGLNARDPQDALEDADKDGLTNLEEYNFGTNPKKGDTDEDGLSDAYEWKYGLNGSLNDAELDYDNDGLTNLQEYRIGSDPQSQDSDKDFFPDKWDYGWWGNPQSRLDNPLIRVLILVILLGLFGLGLWGGLIAIQLPKLYQKLEQDFQQFQQRIHKLLESIKILQDQENLEEINVEAEYLHQEFLLCKKHFLFMQSYVNQKWLPSILRPDLTSWEILVTKMEHNYEECQKNWSKRIEAES